MIGHSVMRAVAALLQVPPQRFRRFVLALGVVQVCAYYLTAMLGSPDGTMLLAQPDTLLYCQAARRIVEGAPFSFSAGTAASTGTTSVLYPFILAIPYGLGFTGTSLLVAGFVLNAVFYLIFLWGWSVAIGRWVEDRGARVVAWLLLALAGHGAYTALAQSDMGAWMALSAVLLAALATERLGIFAVALAVSPWLRPEGMMFGLAFALVALVRRKWSGRLVGVLALFVLSTLGVFALNAFLTGHAQFASVMYKGYFKQNTVPSAVGLAYTAALGMLREIFFGLDGMLPRSLCAMPLLGGVFFIMGLGAHAWSGPALWRKCVWLLAAAFGFLSVAQSGWAGTNTDRYLAWLLPFGCVMTAEGAVWLARRLVPRAVGVALLVALLAYSGGASVVYWSLFVDTGRASNRYRFMGEQCEQVLPKGASVAIGGGCGMAYFMGPRRIAHWSGIYSPELAPLPAFAQSHAHVFMDIIKRQVDRRFDYWLLEGEFYDFRSSDDGERIFGPCVLAGPGGMALYRADWSAFDAAAANPAAQPGERLVARVDVGYPQDEQAADYEVLDRYCRSPSHPVRKALRSADGRLMVDVGRIVCGGDAMTVEVTPGKDLRVVMRVAPKAQSVIDDTQFYERLSVSVSETFGLNIGVNGRVVHQVRCTARREGFSDVSFVIPGKYLAEHACRLSFLGDHIPFGYWFFQ